MPVTDVITDRITPSSWRACALSADQWAKVQSHLDLSARQLQVLQALSECCTVEMAAAKLDSSEAAIESHLGKICRVLELAAFDDLPDRINSALLDRKPDVPAPASDEHDDASSEHCVETPAPELTLAAKYVICLLATGYRFDLLAELMSGPKDVSSLAQAIGASRSTTSQNLRCLRELNLVQFEKEGLNCYYRLAGHVAAKVAADGIALTLPISGLRNVTVHVTSHEAL